MADEAQLHGRRLLQRRVLPAELSVAGVHGNAGANVRWRFRIHLRGIRISGIGEHEQSRVSGGYDWVHPDAVVQPELREAAAHQSVFVCGTQSMVRADWSSEKRSCSASLCRTALLYSVEARIYPLRVRFKAEHESLRVGRFEFMDGDEVKANHPTLAWLKTNRINQRLLGNFGYSDVMRSFDGVQFGYSNGPWNLTAVSAVPTRGVFQVDGWGWLTTPVTYVALMREVELGKSRISNDLRVLKDSPASILHKPRFRQRLGC